MRHIFPVLHRFRGCCLHKWKRKSPEPTRVQRSLAQHCSHSSENVAVMSSSPQPSDAWQPPAEPPSTTRDRCYLVPTSTAILPSHPDLLAIYRHISPLCLPEQHRAIWDYSHAVQTWHPQFLALSSRADKVCAVPSLALS